MATAPVSTRATLLSLIEDIEIVFKELLEYKSVSRSGGSRQDDIDPGQLIALLQLKDAEYQATLKIAREQGEKQKELDTLRSEVQRRDQDVKQLQRNLKEAENVLATAIYQAKQKLQSIEQANQHKISSEELIKYAHKISASNAVAAPPTWVPGDSRRPYPTEIDMRCSLLGRLGDLNAMPGTMYPDALTPGRSQLGGSHSAGPTTLTWQPSAEVQSTMISGLPQPHCTTPIDKSHTKETADSVELMSSDSSSSSSSDE